MLQGVLRVHIVQAKNLVAKDMSLLRKGKSDPYVVVTLGAQQFKTRTINNELNPKWDYWCEVKFIHFSDPNICRNKYNMFIIIV